jgi:Xaa-Pro aminopeptidase
METFFGPDFFSNNRTKLRSLLSSDMPIVITGNGQMQRAADEPFKFTQDSNFWYLTGLSAPDLTLVIGRKDTYLIVPTLSFVREAFDGAHDVAAYAARSGITAIVNSRDGWARIKEELRTGQVATLGSVPAYMKRDGLYTLPYRRRLIERLKRTAPGLAIRDIRPELASLRMIKQPEELHALQQAIDMTAATLAEVAAPDRLAVVSKEYELEAAITYGFRMRGAEDHAFAPIVGAGRHSTTLHHKDNDGLIAHSDLIVLDIGASVEHYAADITRTVSPRPLTGRKADVFKAVAAAQDYALSLIKPGTLPKEYEPAVSKFVGEELRKLGLVTGSTADAVRRYFPHATSHFLGLDTHDTGDYSQPHQPGMVITCEPGIYIPEEGIGVRIEDDVLVTASGNTVLSAACPRGLTPVQ